MRASGGTDALKPQTPRPIDTVSTKRTERTALEGRMAASASFADAQAPPPEDRLWPKADGHAQRRLLMLPTKSGQSVQALVDSSKANGAT